jgi:hypothetical protein
MLKKKAQKPTGNSKKKPIEQYAHKDQQGVNMVKGPDKTARSLVPVSYDSLLGTIRSLVETARYSGRSVGQCLDDGNLLGNRTVYRRV